MNRLETICAWIPCCGVVADIGCDHGKVSEFVVCEGLAERVVVNDISEASLAKARKRLSGVAGNVEFVCCDGADLEKWMDCVVIAGMGGREIERILKSIQPKVAILSPQNYTSQLRYALADMFYDVTKDQTIADCGKYYDILSVTKADDGALPMPDVYAASYGYEYKTPNPALRMRLIRDKNRLQTFKQTTANTRKLEIIEEVLRWQL